MENGTRDILYYDGHCGLCHRSVQFVLKHDPDGSRFRFAPLQSESFTRNIPAATRAQLPDSVVIWTPDRRALTQSDAVLHMLRRLGGIWAIFAALGRLIPRPLRNWMYARIAAIRHRLFAKPEAACPLMPRNLRDRFEL
ncbi:hypothetical protein F183_A31630 [Bryobacterales bacterium F-183]|nr:hypothetical protein F183_A31630 [Bryobacterales bacterium F-183]